MTLIKGEIYETEVVGYHLTNTGPVMDVKIRDQYGIIPLSRLALPQDGTKPEFLMNDLIGQVISAQVRDIDPEGLFSADRAAAMRTIRSREPMQEGDVVRAVVRHVLAKHLYLEARGRLIRVPMQNAVHRPVTTLRYVYAGGQEYETKITKKVEENNGIEIWEGDIKSLSPNPYAKSIYRPGAHLKATVVKIMPQTVIIAFEPGVIGYANATFFPVEVGDEVVAKIRSANAEAKKIHASIIFKIGQPMPPTVQRNK